MKIEEYMKNKDALEVRNYVPVTEKMSSINKRLEQVINQDSVIAAFNSVSIEIMMVLNAIVLFTNLEVTDLSDYDTLCSNNLLSPIIEKIGDDYYTYVKMFRMRQADYIREINSIDKIIERMLTALNDFVDKIDPQLINEWVKQLVK